jgi:MFS family permease
MGARGTEPTTAEKLRALPWDIAFSAANSIFVQFTFFGSVFVLFLAELGLTKTQIGAMLSLLPFSNLVAVFIAPTIGRYGYKRTFLVAWGVRTVVTVFLLLTPWVASQFGIEAVLLYVSAIVAGFAIWRSVGMTARLPWEQEFVPDSVRGKFSALSNVFSQFTAFWAVILAGFVVGQTAGLTGFIILFALGVVAGVIAIRAAANVPGGAPTRGSRTDSASYGNLLEATRDQNFRLFLVGVAGFTMASGPIASFLPLFMEEEVGLSSGQVVWLQNGTLLGGLVFGYLWGWLADRYGSKPVMMSGIALQVLLPICWLLMPRYARWSLYVALVVAFFQGMANIGLVIGSTRLRFVAVVPPDRKAQYQALYFAWIGIVSGVGQLFAGRILDASQGITGRFLIFALDSYSVLFFLGVILPIIAALLLRRVRADSAVSTGTFAAMFFHGNPLMALETLVRYHRARDERAAVSMTERLGRTESPLTVDELLEALSDPRFYVRFEAIVSIARRGPDERLLEALTEVLCCGEPALSTIAAWALGRIGDERAIEPLRAGLEAEYRSVQAHCARSLGSLGDVESLPLLLERLKIETDVGLQLAYCSALGKLRAKEAAGIMLRYLRVYEDESACEELALALARLIGDEHRFIQLLRQTKVDAGTATSQAVTALKRRISQFEAGGSYLFTALDACADALAREELERGVGLLTEIIRSLPLEEWDPAAAEILADCADCLDERGAARMEYVILALHAMRIGFAEQESSAFTQAFGDVS